MVKFYLRMFGDKKTYRLNQERIPHRTVKSLHDELRWLYNRIMEQKEPGFRWDYAITSEFDRVFPSKNQKSYWQKEENTQHIILPLNHYLFHHWASFSEFIGFVETYTNKKKSKIIL
jgi:hypothetical protein